MKFSVVVPVYNVEKYIDECITSVLTQEYRDFELILVDDGSMDQSGIICDTYKKNSDQIVVIHQDNRGLISARNVGVSVAKGDYILFLDSDDTLRHDALQILFDHLKHDESDMIMFNFSKEADYATRYTEYPFEPNSYVKKSEIAKEIALGMGLNNLCNKCIKRELVASYEENVQDAWVRNGEDLIRLLPMLDKVKTFFYLDENLYYYRTNEISMSHTIGSVYVKSVLQCDVIRKEYLVKWNVERDIIECGDVYRCCSIAVAILYSKNSLYEKYKLFKILAQSSFFTEVCRSKKIKELPVKRKMLMNAMKWMHCLHIF